jgi:hypothetical protein
MQAMVHYVRAGAYNVSEHSSLNSKLTQRVVVFSSLLSVFFLFCLELALVIINLSPAVSKLILPDMSSELKYAIIYQTEECSILGCYAVWLL